MINPKMYQKPVVGIGIAALVAVLCLAALASDSARIEKPAAVDVEQYADFIENEVFDIQDLAEGAEIQRRMFNRITPQGISWVQPMFPPVVPFDAENFDEKFLDGLLGEDKNSVAIYPLSLALDPKTRETLVFNAEGKLIATILADRIPREWPEDADPARVTLQLDLLPAEDVEPYLYTESRIADYSETLTAKATKSGGMVLRSLGASEFGIAGVQRLTNGSMRITVTNGADTAEVFSYTVWHTSTITTNEWVDEYGVTNIGTNTLWTPVSPPFNGIDSEWECLTTNLALSGGVGVYEDANISSNARVRFYAVANRLDSDGDGLTDGAEIFIHRTDPGNPDTDGDGWSDAEELAEETDPLDRFSATTLARGVVLNEVLYDASGTDLGKEWIELYSAGRYPVDVGGFVVQVADTAYSNAYVFPSNTWIDPGRFLLLGGSLVTNRDLEVDFTMPNRFTNDATAAVRLAAEVGTNTFVADCLMYGGNAANFNPNGLDTTGWISTNARSAGAGNSLIRLFSGHDTDQVLDWKWQSAPVPGSSVDIPDSDGDGLTDQEELTGSQNPYGAPTYRHNADSDGDGLSDLYECLTSETNPNTWATDGDIFPWPPPSGAVSNWWGSDPYELANGWNPQVFDENTNGIPDSWEMAFPGTNLYADADNDGISNYDELLQNSDPNSSDSNTAQPFVLRYESSIPGWANDGMQDVGLKGWVNVYFEQLKPSVGLCVMVTEGMTQEQFKVVWHDTTQEGVPFWVNEQQVLLGASVEAGSRPYLHIEDLGMHPEYTNTLGGEYLVQAAAARLVADHNRDRTLDAADGNYPGPFRFWINDDNDDGAIASGSSDIPGEGSGNASDTAVNGYSDLVDFFPLWLDIGSVLGLLDSHGFTVSLQYEPGGIGFVYTELAPEQACSYLTNSAAASAALSETVNLIDGFGTGHPLDEAFLSSIQQDGHGVLLVEGRYASDPPLQLNILDPNGEIFCTAELPLQMSGVEDFYRWINLRPGQQGDSRTGDPENNPDLFTNGKNVFFLHGFNVDADAARGWNAEVFKRLYWAGSKAKFWGMTWDGDVGLINALCYQEDVANALAVASNFNAQVSGVGGDKIVLAHSLGNMVVSGAIQDYGLSVNKYFMLNAAVASECYDPTAFNDATNGNYMVNEDWAGYSNKTWTAKWNELFSEPDDREKLSWNNRFPDVAAVAYNYCSTGDEIFEIYAGMPSAFAGGPFHLERYAWQKQELFKGRTVLGVPVLGGTAWAGWGFSGEYTMAQANAATESQLRTNAVFRHAPTSMFSSNILEQAVNDILAQGIPALSAAAGVTNFTLPYSDRYFDANAAACKPNGWGRSGLPYNDRRLHSDIKNMAYYYTYELYNIIVSHGGLQ